ncbi:SufS family cysteine desulfurase [Candidatus Nomurabacteria bacterium]|nr:SufS family cysteine desulfurase [Candidatus Nomurabacteria bacterium]
MKNIRHQFPLLKNYKDLVYLDNAATTQKPQSVIKTVTQFYQRQNANVHRGAYKLSDTSSRLYLQAHKTIADFIDAREDEIIFNSGATEGINTLAYSLCKDIDSKSNVVITQMEHHSNLIPWAEMAKRKGFGLRVIPFDHQSQALDLDALDTLIDENTKVVSIIHVSNVLGVISPVDAIIKRARAVGAYTIIDACQSVAHMPLSMKALDCDFCVFSGHKIYGPTGIGVLYGKRALLSKMDPFMYGGGMVGMLTDDSIAWNDLPMKFEAGTPNIAGAIGLAAAVEFLQEIGMDVVKEHSISLTKYAVEALGSVSGVRLYASSAQRMGVLPLSVTGVHSHDVASVFDSENIAVRSGQHCATPIVRSFTEEGIVRASVAVYNDEKDIDRLIIALEKVKKMFKV